MNIRRPVESQLGLFGTASHQTWSYSRLKSLRRCALEYKVRWVEGQEALFQPGYIQVQAGRLLHQIVREYYRTPLAGRSHQFLVETYERLAPRSPTWREDLQGETRTLTDLRFFAHSKASRFQPVALEVTCESHVAGAVFGGKADLIYQSDEHPGTYGVLDFKLNDAEVRVEHYVERFLQCAIYYLGLPDQYRQMCGLLSIYVFDTGQLLETRVEPSLVQGVVGIVEAALQRADGPEFPPTLNPFCSSCGYQTLCPAYSKRQWRKVGAGA